METKYDAKKGGWVIVYTPNQWIKKDLWGKPVNDKVYESWDEAMHVMDKWAS